MYGYIAESYAGVLTRGDVVQLFDGFTMNLGGNRSEAARRCGLTGKTTYDWKEAMEYSKFRFDQIEKVIFAIDGENDAEAWLLLVELKGGGYGVLRAWCDYTGWDCQAGGESGIFETLEQAQQAIVNNKAVIEQMLDDFNHNLIDFAKAIKKN